MTRVLSLCRLCAAQGSRARARVGVVSPASEGSCCWRCCCRGCGGVPDRAAWRWGVRRRRRSARRTSVEAPRRTPRRPSWWRRRSSTTPSTYRTRTRRTTGCAGGGYVRALSLIAFLSNLDLRRPRVRLGDLDCVMRVVSLDLEMVGWCVLCRVLIVCVCPEIRTSNARMIS